MLNLDVNESGFTFDFSRPFACGWNANDWACVCAATHPLLGTETLSGQSYFDHCEREAFNHNSRINDRFVNPCVVPTVTRSLKHGPLWGLDTILAGALYKGEN
jgi:hypothetical protein